MARSIRGEHPPCRGHGFALVHEPSALQAYTGDPWFEASAPGVTICLANILVAKELRGQKCFASLVERFLDGTDNLEARVLYMENIASPRFERWLALAGFHQCAYTTSGEFSAYYLVR